MRRLPSIRVRKGVIPVGIVCIGFVKCSCSLVLALVILLVAVVLVLVLVTVSVLLLMVPSLVFDFRTLSLFSPQHACSGPLATDRLLLLQGGATPHAGGGHVLHGGGGGSPPLHQEPGAAVRAARAAAGRIGSPAVVVGTWLSYYIAKRERWLRFFFECCVSYGWGVERRNNLFKKQIPYERCWVYGLEVPPPTSTSTPPSQVRLELLAPSFIYLHAFWHFLCVRCTVPCSDWLVGGGGLAVLSSVWKRRERGRGAVPIPERQRED